MIDEAMTDPAVANPEIATSAEKTERREIRPFPRWMLTDAIKVVHAIKDSNAGKPFATNQVAEAIGRRPRSSDFRSILAAAQFYGLTDGTAKAGSVSLTDLGKAIAYPKTSQEEIESRINAFLQVDLFKKVFDHYQNNSLPDVKFFANTLESEFKIHRDHVEEFIKIFEGNLRFLGVDARKSVSFSVTPTEEVVVEIAQTRSVVRSGRNKAFVIMPFVEKGNIRAEGFFKEVYRSLIEPAAQQAGFDVDWANRAGSDVIQSTIINEILDADLLIADLTDHNPNVLFELGLRLAYNKGPTALMKSQDTPRLFDVDNMIRVYEYKPTLWKTSLEVDVPNLEEHIRATFENRNSQETYINILRKRRADP